MTNLSEISTKELVEELRNREGVDAHDIEPYQPYSINIQATRKCVSVGIVDDGPAIIMVVTD